MKAQQIRCLVCGFTAMLIFEKTQKIINPCTTPAWYCPHCGSEDTENMAGIQELIEKSKENVIAIMCSETDYKKCHRYQKITPELEKAGIMPKPVKEHNCAKHIKLDNEFDLVDNEMIFSGECTVCGKKVTQTFTYKDTREQDSDKVIDVCEKPFVDVSVWRKMNANTITASIIAGLDVLRDTGSDEND